LLHCCQGHHLATFGEPLFADAATVCEISRTTTADLGEAELNTVGYVLSRLGHLSEDELEHVVNCDSWSLLGWPVRQASPGFGDCSSPLLPRRGTLLGISPGRGRILSRDAGDG
jgi:hypothetical protein